MKRIRRALSVSVALGVVLALGVPAQAFGALTFGAGGTIIQEPSYFFTQPDIDGRYVVANRYEEMGSRLDVVIYNHQTGMTSIMTPTGDGADQHSPAVSGDRVVWIDNTEADGEVYYNDLGDPAPPLRITTDTNDDVGVRIDGNWIVWRNGITPGSDIAWYNIETAERGIAIPDITPVSPNGIRVDRGRVVYYDSKEVGFEGVYAYDLETGAESTVQRVPVATNHLGQTVIHGDTVAWSLWSTAVPDDKTIVMTNLRSGTVGSPTAMSADTQQYPSVFGGLTVWQDDRNTNEDIMGWWEAEPPVLQYVTTAAGNQTTPDVYGHSVVYQVGASGADIALAAADLKATRLAGGDRYATSARISAYRFPTSKMAVIATGADFADALAASSLAGAQMCPLLLTEQAGLPASTAAELDRLGVLGAFVVGGTGAVGDGVVDDLEDMGINVTRISGANRYATARQVANYLIDIMGNENRRWRGEAFFCRGDDFADALAVAPHAYALGMPILLVQTNGVPADTAAAISSLGIHDGYVIGGVGAITNATQTTLNGLCGNPTERWYGANRYETAAYCAWKGWDKGWLDWDAVGVATGTNFPDALSGGAASGYYGSPIVLTAPNAVPTAVASFFTAHRYDFGGMDVYGGTGAVNAATFTQLQGYLD